MSYFFAAAPPRSPAAMFTTRYGRSRLPTISSSTEHEELELVPARSRMAEGEHLDLVELMHAEHAAHVLAVGAGLPPEACGVARVPDAAARLRRGSLPCGMRRAIPPTCRRDRAGPRRSGRCWPRPSGGIRSRTSPPREPARAGSTERTPCRPGCPSRDASARIARTRGRRADRRSVSRSRVRRVRCRAPRAAPRAPRGRCGSKSNTVGSR